MSDVHEGDTADEADEEGTDAKGQDADPASDDANAVVANSGDESDEKEQPPAHRKDRRLTLIVALVGLLGVLLVAAGTLIGVFITNSAHRDQSVAEFRREQRKTAYPRILSLATDLKNATDVAGTNLSLLGLGLGPSLTYSYYLNRSYSAPQGYTGAQYTGTDFQSPLGSVRNDWQAAYAALDQAIAEAQIVGKCETLNIARALRDKYFDDYTATVHTQLEAIQQAAKAFQEKLPPEQRGPSLEGVTVEQIVGVKKPAPVKCSEGGDDDLTGKTAPQLTEDYVRVTKAELDLNDR